MLRVDRCTLLGTSTCLSDSLKSNLNKHGALFFILCISGRRVLLMMRSYLLIFLTNRVKMGEMTASKCTWRSDPVPPTSFILIQPHLRFYPPSAFGVSGFTPLEAGVHFDAFF